MCLGATGYTLCGPDGAAAYLWSLGGETTQCISMDGLGVGLHDFDLTVTDGNGCESTCSFTFEVFSVDPCIITGPAEICEGAEGFELCGPGGMSSYSWLPGGGTTECISLDGLEAGTHDFELTVVDANGCQTTCLHSVDVYPGEPCEICGPSRLCEGATGFRLFGPYDAAAYLWSPGGETSRNISLDGLEPGIHLFELTVTHPNGCVSRCSHEVEVYERPEVCLEGPTEICIGELPVTICGPEAPPGANWVYDWTTSVPRARRSDVLGSKGGGANRGGEGRPDHCYDFDPGEPGTFVVTLVVTDLETGCESFPASVEITVIGAPPAPERPELDPELACYGDDVAVSWEPVSRAVTYGLLLNGDEIWSGSETSIVVPAFEGAYSVTAVNGCGEISEGDGRALIVSEPPELLSADEYGGAPGQAEIELYGLGFWDAPRDTFAVVFDGGFQVLAADCISWSDELIALLVPAGVPTGTMRVKVCDVSNALGWTPVEGAFYAVLTEDGAVQLRWTVEALAGVNGFNVYRATSPDGPFDRLNEEPIAPVSPGAFEDETAWPGTTFWYELRAMLSDGSEDTVGGSLATVATGGHLGLALSPGWPNPFTDTVTMQLDVPVSSASVTLTVYDLRGRAVKHLINGSVDRGRRSVVWDGTDATGEPVSSGVYFVRLRMGDVDVATKLLLTR